MRVPNTPLSERYEEEPEHAPTDHPAFNPSETWGNYWDANPQGHGGKFVRWTGGKWEVYITWPPQGTEGAEYYVYYEEIRPRDVWEDPSDPMTDFTQPMKSELNALDDGHHLPAAEPFLEQIDYYVAGMAGIDHARETGTFTCEDEGLVDCYWSNLKKYGIDPDEVDHLSDKARPTDDD